MICISLWYQEAAQLAADQNTASLSCKLFVALLEGLNIWICDNNKRICAQDVCPVSKYSPLTRKAIRLRIMQQAGAQSRGETKNPTKIKKCLVKYTTLSRRYFPSLYVCNPRDSTHQIPNTVAQEQLSIFNFKMLWCLNVNIMGDMKTSVTQSSSARARQGINWWNRINTGGKEGAISRTVRLSK